MANRAFDDTPDSRCSSRASSSGQSIILKTPRDASPQEKKLAEKDHEQWMLKTSQISPTAGYELPYDGFQAVHPRQIPPHRVLASTYEVVQTHSGVAEPPPCLVVRFKRATRVFWAEFFGTAVLALFGTAVNNQVALSSSTLVSNSPAGTFLSVSFGWALAVMLGVFVSAGISGGHINPAITLAMAIFRRFPWYKVPVYWLAQISGAVVGAGLTYLNYSSAINLYEGGGGVRTIEKTGGLYFTNPLSDLTAMLNGRRAVLTALANQHSLPYTTNYLCFYNEVLMTAILVIFVVAVGDEGNTCPPKNMGPFVIFWVVFGLASTLGMQTSFALNPARDLGPRIVTWLAGYGGEVWSVRSSYWFSVAILGPVFGAILGCFIYDFFIATEKVSDCVLHQRHDVAALMKKLRDITPLKDPEQTNLTTFERRRPPRKEGPVGRRPSAQRDDAGATTDSARTTSHRYTTLSRG